MPESQVRVAVLGSGNIGTDLMYKILADPGAMELAMVAGIDPASEGLARAREAGVTTSHAGIDEILEDDTIRVVFDATSAGAHRRHAVLLRESGRRAIDLTPAAVGPYVVPSVNLDAMGTAENVNLITCGGQATIPIVAAVSAVVPVRYAEMVSTISSASAGPGTRQNIDEFTSTTAGALEQVGGAQQAKAIIVLNPADPPILMRNTVYVVPDAACDPDAISASVEAMVQRVRAYVPGYRLTSDVVFDERDTAWGTRPVVAVLIEVEGAGDYLPAHAGNLDIMTAAARRVGDLTAAQLVATTQEATA